MAIINQAFVFIKPHVFHHAGVHGLIAEKLKTSGIRVIRDGIVTAERMAAEQLIDRHYAINARAATCTDPASLKLGPTARATFARLFGCDWQAACDAGRLCGATTMQQKLGGISGEQLAALWSASGSQKVTGGLYVAYFAQQDCFVFNGFYPALRDNYTTPGRAIHWMVVQFDAEALPWQQFRADVIGTTNPASANPDSIRGMAHARADQLGIKVGYRANVIHASASPFEALVEQLCWIEHFKLTDDPLGSILADAGISPATVLAWRNTNPRVTFEGNTGRLVDIAEDRDTPAVAALLKQVKEIFGQTVDML